MYYRLFSILIMIGLFANCSSDDSKPGFDFKKQNLQGTLENVPWIFQTGSATIEDEMLQIVLFDLDVQVPNVCFPFGGVKSITFTISNQVGLYPLANLSSDSPVTVTYFSAEKQLNFITADGAVEISSISLTGITGRMDLQWPVYEGEFEGGTINGSFVIPICE